MITDEMVEVAERTRYSACKLPYAAMRLGLEAVLPMIRAEVLEEAAKWHDAEAKRWNVELWERRSWGGPTIGEGECLEHIKAHEHSAATIRAMKGTSHE
jgi:hypothetical protein